MITNALIIDHWGIVKGDIGIRDGRIVKVGKAGNPDTMAGVDPDLVVGASTEVIAGENLIVTAGAHRQPHPFHFAAADLRGALERHHHHDRRRHRARHRHQRHHLHARAPGTWRACCEAADAWPMNFGFLGKGQRRDAASRWPNRSRPAPAA